MTIEFIPTADLVDEIGPDVRSCDIRMRNLGGRLEFCSKTSTIKCFQDSALLKKVLSESSEDGVFAIDGDASAYAAPVDDVIAELGKDNGWAGVVVNGVIRDSKLIGGIDSGCRAFGINPRKSTKTGEGERDVVVSFGDVDFVPGEMPYADSDGIVVR